MLRVEDLAYPASTNKSVLLVSHVGRGSSVPCMKKKKKQKKSRRTSIQPSAERIHLRLLVWSQFLIGPPKGSSVPSSGVWRFAATCRTCRPVDVLRPTIAARSFCSFGARQTYPNSKAPKSGSFAPQDRPLPCRGGRESVCRPASLLGSSGASAPWLHSPQQADRMLCWPVLCTANLPCVTACCPRPTQQCSGMVSSHRFSCPACSTARHYKLRADGICLHKPLR